MRPAIKVGLSFLSPVFIIIIAKMHKKRPNIFSGAGISLKRKAERMVGIKMPSRLKVVVSGAPFLRILIWISTRALTKPIPLMMPRRTVSKSHELQKNQVSNEVIVQDITTENRLEIIWLIHHGPFLPH